MGIQVTQFGIGYASAELDAIPGEVLQTPIVGATSCDLQPAAGTAEDSNRGIQMLVGHELGHDEEVVVVLSVSECVDSHRRVDHVGVPAIGFGDPTAYVF